MSERTEVILYVVWATFIMVVFIVWLLLSRGGRSTETKAVLDAIEGVRNQQDVLDQSVRSDLRSIKQWLTKLLARFGFLQQGPKE